ncbi:hypothetical protein BH09VER1_BH09VER1_35140 [soil metagenome]
MKDEGNEEKDKEDHEKHMCDPYGLPSDSAESQDTCDECNNEEGKSPA